MSDGPRSAAELAAEWVKARKAAELAAAKSDAAKAAEAEAWAAWMEAKKTEVWEWLETSAGREWASADEADNDGGPTESDLRGEVQHG